jgi:hypothetical protein
MDAPAQLTADQIAQLAAMVGSWTPRSGKVDEAVFHDDDPDVILDVKVLLQSGDRLPVRIRMCRDWLDRVSVDELESHTHRVLSIIEGRNLEI